MIRKIRYIFHFSQYSFSHHPRKSRHQNKFLLRQQRNKNKPLSCLRLKTISMRCLSCFFIKTVMLLLSWQKIFFSDINWSRFLLQFISVMLFFFLCIDIILRIVLQLLNVVLNLCVIKNYTIAPHVLYTTHI